ncbi:MAG: N-acetyltransferase [Candidatus Xenobia bacterium]
MDIRRARIPEAPAIADLVNHYAGQGMMLPKNVLEVYEHIREFYVAVEDSGMLACGALRIMWHDLAEVRSLAVSQAAQGRGLGRQIVEALIEEARDLGLARLFALTYQVSFFEKLGFAVVSKEIFPQKVWLDCKGCLKQACCDETAMILVLDPERAAVGEAESLKQVFARQKLAKLAKR